MAVAEIKRALIAAYSPERADQLLGEVGLSTRADIASFFLTNLSPGDTDILEMVEWRTYDVAIGVTGEAERRMRAAYVIADAFLRIGRE